MKKRANLAVITTMLASSLALADEPKKQENHSDYLATGVVATVAGPEASVQNLDVEKPRAGFQFIRRVPIDEDKGIQITFSMAKGFANSTLAFSFLKDNLEAYIGAGYTLFNGDSCANPHVGVRAHIGDWHGLYISGEFGGLLGRQPGLYGSMGLGFRIDIDPD